MTDPRDKADELIGKGKQAAGDALDDDQLRREGQADEAGAKIKQAADKVADKAKDAVDSIKDAFDKDK